MQQPRRLRLGARLVPLPAIENAGVSFVDARGSAYGPYTKMSSTFDPVNLKTINYVGRAPPFGDVSIYIDRPSLFYSVL